MHNMLKKKISSHLNQVFHDGDVEVTTYPSYGFLSGTEWLIPLRGWVHQNRRLPDHLINESAQANFSPELLSKNILAENTRSLLIDSHLRLASQDLRSHGRTDYATAGTVSRDEKLAIAIQREHQRPYAKNNLPPCGRG